MRCIFVLSPICSTAQTHHNNDHSINLSTMMTEAGQEIQLQCSPVRRAMERNEYEQTIGEAEILSFPLASPRKISPHQQRSVTPTTRPALVSHPPAAKTAPRRRLQNSNGNKSLLDVSCDTSCCDCANTTRDSSFDCHLHYNDSANLTSLLGLSAINNDSDFHCHHPHQHNEDDGDDYNDDEKEHIHLLDDNDDIIVPKILFPEEMMHGTSGPMDGDVADEVDFDGDEEDDDASDIDHDDEVGEVAPSSPFKDLTNIGGGGKNQRQKLKDADVTEATASLSASFFHNLSSTIADSFFCGGGGVVSPGISQTPQASPVRCRVIPRASPSSGRSAAAATPHRPHHLPRPSPSRSLILSTPLRTETPGRLVAASATGDNAANRSTLSEMEDAVREHFRRLDCYANTGTPIRTPEKCEETEQCGAKDKITTVTPQKQQLMELYENRNDASMFHSAMTKNKFFNRAAQPARLQAERLQRLYFHGTLPSCHGASLTPLELAADASLSARLKQVEPIENDDGPSFQLSRATSFDDVLLGDENDNSCQASAQKEEQDADLSTLIGCIEPISMLSGDSECGPDQMHANIPSDDVCYDSDPGDIEQTLTRRKHFEGNSHQKNDLEGRATMRRKRRNLKSSIAIVQVRFIIAHFVSLLFLCNLSTILIF